MIKRYSVIACAVAMTFSNSITAEPWIDSKDIYLRQSIEQLVSYGVIKHPVTSYPIMWQGIANDLTDVNLSKLPKEAEFALNHVRHALRFAQKSVRSGIKLKANSKPNEQQAFGERYQEQAALQGYSMMMGERVTAKVSVQLASDANSGKKIAYDDSYLAVIFGNWVVSGEKINHWWGPANENALMLSNNASPMKALRLTRLNSDYFGPNLLSFIGNWQFTALLGEQKHNKQTPSSNKFFGARFSTSPFQGLELGYSQTAQFDANNQDHDFADFNNVLIGKNKFKNDSIINEYNQLVSLDAKYSSQLFGQSMAVYGELAGDKQNSMLPEHRNYTVGIEHYFGQADYLVKSYLEYTNTQQQCGDNTQPYHCGYQHPYFADGYQHHSQNIGASIAENAKSMTLASQYHQTNGIAAYAKLRFIEQDQATNNPLAKNQKRYQIELGYQQGVFNGLWQVSAQFGKQESDLNPKSDRISALRTSWEYRF